MKYNSLREYFYKLHNLLYAIVLVPFLAFVVLYWQLQEGNIKGQFPFDDWYRNLMLGACSMILITDWLVSGFLFSRGLKATRKLESLGRKLDRYFLFTLFRFALIISGTLTLAVAFYLTENQYFTIIFVANMALLILLWPTTSKVCNDLHLKGDERTLVLYKKDRL